VTPTAKRFFTTLTVAGKLNYAAGTSTDELEIFWTRFNGTEPAIYMANLPNTSKPFGAAEKIKDITGFAEAPWISADGRSLHYHMKNPEGVFSICRVTRA
jgi:hypothetical protein